MKQKIIVLIGILMTAFACNDDDNILPNIEGHYTGFFKQNGENGDTSKVELNLDNGVFSAESDAVKVSPTCSSGSYSVSSSLIEFKNQCFFTIGFDRTLIFTGRWHYTFKDNTLTLTGANGDEYVLTKQ